MIEFKADCGHTVRAKDENAGGVVRCSYCGREAHVPENKEDELDFLFRDLEKGDEVKRKARRRRRKAGGPPTAGGAPRRQFDPFAVVLRLCYAAGLIVIVIVVGQKFVVPLFKEGVADVVRKGAGAKAEDAIPEKRKRSDSRKGAQPSKERFGLRKIDEVHGLYVASTPRGAAVYYIEHDRASPSGRIHTDKSSRRFAEGAVSSGSKIKDGMYVVEVVFPWNDRSLVDYPGYTQIRRELIATTDEKRRHELLEEYFLPDEATTVFFDDKTSDKMYIVRQYRDVIVRNGRSAGVRALFLPRIDADGNLIPIEALVAGYLPNISAYHVDRDYVRAELAVYDVPVGDRDFLFLALERLGAMAYTMPDKRTMFFEVDLYDGTLTAKIIRERRR